MKYLLSTGASLAVLLLGCGIDFSTRYDRIEESRVRPLAFVYDHEGYAEAAPGDTVSLRGYFAGERVTSIDWTVSTTLIVNQFGTDTFADTVAFDRYMVPGSYHEYFGGITDSVRFNFVVPDDLVRSRFSDDMTIAGLLPPGVADTLLPGSVREMTPASLIDLIEVFGSGDLPSGSFTLPDSIAAMIPVLLQAFTVNMKVFARINGHYLVESTFTVRYNTRLHRNLPSVPVNRNPVIEWIRCYRLRKDPAVFDPVHDGGLVDTVFRLFPENDTIVIDAGYHYFFAADSGTAALDSGLSLTDPSHRRRPEQLSYEWFYQNADTIPGQQFDSLMLLDNAFRGTSVTLLPSFDVRLRHFNLWLVSYDGFLGEKFRPVGFALYCINGTFAYTDAYRNLHGAR
jgi:hypothetical protein